MADLKTTYMGLELDNPVIAASSRLTASLDKILQCEEAGAGAVVLKSLFEEQILADTSKSMDDIDIDIHPEARDFFNVSGQNYFMDEYLKLVKESKKKIKIPVIASINCVSPGKWMDYADRFEQAGADALELNFFIMPANPAMESAEIENLYIDIVRKIKSRVNIPVAMKIGCYFSSLASMIIKLSKEGIDGLVLFNRFYRPDINIDTLSLKSAPVLSHANELSHSLQWIALLSGKIKAGLAASTGIHDAEGAVKALLAGADAIQVCSTLLKNGIGYIKEIKSGIAAWMSEKGFNTLQDFKGRLSSENQKNPEVFERSQYIKAIVGIS